jgi:class 3 adenylate cyclase/tetratricopeptide (TPR) repeat protein
MACAACGAESPAGARFCMHCGEPLPIACGACGAGVPKDARFCPQCAHPTSAAAVTAASSPSAPARSVASYTPKHLADKILQSRSALEGERKQVTVLFADVKGSMELAAQLDPEEWHRILERFFEILAEGVHRFEGTVNQYTGDGIMALFGAPIAHEDHAQRACFAAQHLLEAVRGHARDVKRRHGLEFAVRVGLHSGEVVVGRIGDDLRMDYTAQGHSVGLAQRMESLAEPNSCFASSATAALAKGYFEFEDLGAFNVKGFAEPVPVFALRGVGPVRTRFGASRARGLTRFVGRDDDMRTLETALVRAREGHGQVVGVVADAGTGKSRLCFEFAERCRARGAIVLEAQAVAHGKNVPLLPILQVFRAYFGIAERDDDLTVREKIAGRLLLLDDGFRDLLPVMFDFLGAPDPERPSPRVDPEARQRMLFAVLRKVVQQELPSGPEYVSLIEDLHWMDGASEAFLSEWVEAIGSARRLLIVNFRPEYRAAWMQKSYYHQISLAPLGPEAIRELLVDLLGADPSTAGLAALIHARTAGNPFYAEEVVQTLIESGNLQGTRGAYRLVTPIERVDVPRSVQALLAARIDRLSESEKQVLQTAAVIGKEFAEPILREVVSATRGARAADTEIAQALATLRAREFIHETALYPVTEYAFKHPLTQEVALGSQLVETRKRTHAAVARAIESAHVDKLDEQAAVLAHHFGEAGETLLAVRWHARAARYIGASDFSEAARHWQRAIDLVAQVPDDPGVPALGAEACFQLLTFSFRLSFTEESIARAFADGTRWAERASDPLLVGRMHQAMSVSDIDRGRIESAIRHAEVWGDAAQAAEDPRIRCTANWPLLWPLFIRGDLAELRRVAQLQVELTRDHPDAGVREWGISAQTDAFVQLATAERYDGSLARARELYSQVLEIARRTGEPEWETVACAGLAEIGLTTRDAELAGTGLQRCSEISEQLGETARASARMQLCTHLLLTGRIADAHAALGEAFEGPSASRFRRPGVFADILLASGEAERAARELERALEECLEGGFRLQAVEAALALSSALRARSGAAAADRIEALAKLADGLIEETGARNLSPLVALERAELCALRGDTEGRYARLREARAGFARMGAPARVREIDERLGGATRAQ